MKLDSDAISDLDERFRALFINSLSGFKSANLVGTQNKQGNMNLSIVSSVFHLGAHPPLIGMIMRPHTVRRDTLENILETGYYTLNHVNEHILKQAHQTSARYEANQSEFEQVGLTPICQPNITAPFVRESQLKIGVKLVETQTLKVNNTELVIGEIIWVDVADGCVSEDGYIDIGQLGTVAVSSLDCYHQPNKIGRLSYAKPDRPTRFIEE
ncbi:flavin oxidoreductase [Alteromonadaceae bacterium M269]|nr:flavin oxidoreductase [Alteromonadaceae bacterium M269]